MPAELVSGLIAFASYFAGALAYGALFCAIYTRLTPHREFDLIVNQHNASAAVAFGMTLIGYAIALAGAIHNTQSIVEFLIWGLIAMLAQIVAFALAKLAHPGLSQALEQNALAAAIWSGSVAVATGLITAACMSP